MIWRSGNWARALPVHLLLLPAFFDVSVAPSLCLTAGSCTQDGAGTNQHEPATPSLNT